MPPLVELQQRILTVNSLQWPSADQLNLLASIPETVYTFLSSEDDTTLALNHWLDNQANATLNFQNLPSARDVLANLARSSFDTATRRWANAVLLQNTPEDDDILTWLAERPTGQKLLSLLEPRTLSRLPAISTWRTWSSGEEIRLPHKGVAIVLNGGCELNNLSFVRAPTTSSTPLSFLGLLDHLGGPGTSGPRDGLQADHDGLMALVFDGAGFRELLDIAPVLEVELTRQLAWACSPETTLQLH